MFRTEWRVSIPDRSARCGCWLDLGKGTISPIVISSPTLGKNAFWSSSLEPQILTGSHETALIQIKENDLM